MGTYYLFLGLILAALVWFKWNLPKIKGIAGEKQVARILNTLDTNEYILMNDLYLPKEDGKTTQIDHVLIGPQGIFVIETKNYKGWITGSEHKETWTQTNYKRKDKFYNPIWQNSGHIKALRVAIGDNLNDVPIHSIIVFGRQAELKFTQPFKQATVMNCHQLLSHIKLEESANTNALTYFNRKKVMHLLSQYILKDRKAQKEQSKKHVEYLKNDRSERDLKVSSNICPRCGSHLVMRKGKKGEFKGCSSFPKCRFIA
ncbi:NERD domain-containing protein [Mesobacillus maritimus]|uniref:NERD domain-containing protein n=1 Tax=Mesobacillus maritimus TaxID=1643336 RepID=UPI00385151E0